MRIILTALAILAAAPARAQTPALPPTGGCVTQKLKTFCPDAKFGSPEFAACSQAHLAAASAGCSPTGPGGAPLAETQTFDPKNPCAEDAQKFCRGNWPGTPAADACLKTHQKELTPACAAFGHTNAPVRDAKIEAACVADAKALCPGLTADDGKKYADCMTENAAKLSPACRKARMAAKTKPAAKSGGTNAERTSSQSGRTDTEGK